VAGSRSGGSTPSTSSRATCNAVIRRPSSCPVGRRGRPQPVGLGSSAGHPLNDRASAPISSREPRGDAARGSRPSPLASVVFVHLPAARLCPREEHPRTIATFRVDAADRRPETELEAETNTTRSPTAARITTLSSGLHGELVERALGRGSLHEDVSSRRSPSVNRFAHAEPSLRRRDRT